MNLPPTPHPVTEAQREDLKQRVLMVAATIGLAGVLFLAHVVFGLTI